MKNRNYLIVLYKEIKQKDQIQIMNLIEKVDTDLYLKLNRILPSIFNCIPKSDSKIYEKIEKDLKNSFKISSIINLSNIWKYLIIIDCPNYEFTWVLKTILISYYGEETIQSFIGFD